jgi:L-ascorbate metabolism protein UlaG (beta-lactamase superfamily)
MALMRLKVLLVAPVVLFLLLLAGIGIALNWRPLLPLVGEVRPVTQPAAEAGLLQAQFFGTSTLLISDGATRLMCDGFFSRPSWLRLLATPLEPDEARIQAALAQGDVTTLDAVFVAHSHHDHAMDAGRVAARTGALLYGSASTHQIARGDGLAPERMRLLQPGQAQVIGSFTLTAFETPHSPEPVFPGFITEPFKFPARLSQFKEGQSYSFLLEHARGNLLIVPSANYRPGAFAGVKADTVVLGIGGLGRQSNDFVQAYWRETVVQTGAKRVVPVHWDDFGLGLDEPLQAMPYALDRVDLGLSRLQELAASHGVEVQMPRAFMRFQLP